MPTKHGMYGTRVYNAWRMMKYRCQKPTAKRYERYGGRGIRVCERWCRFENFYSDMGEPGLGESLDRIDNDGDYCPENCRWATTLEQANNKSSNHVLEVDGRKQSVASWARESGLSQFTIHSRLRKGKCPKEAVSAC